MFVSSPYSILRTHEYEILKSLDLSGRVLDLGGGLSTEYGWRMPTHLLSVNRNPSAKPSVLSDLNFSLPFRSGAFDCVLSLNTFEHLEKDEVALDESLRVLMSGGVFHIFVPFIFAVHGSPFDWHRHTADWWHARVCKAGANEASIRVVPLGWCRLSSALSLVEAGRLRAMRGLVMAISLFHSQLGRLMGRPIGLTGYLDHTAVPLGYYVTGQKR
jgi:SAM-dependent methyltransferase